MPHDLAAMVAGFRVQGRLLDIAPYGNGHINDTYASRMETPAGVVRYIHQRINHAIFKEPDRLMANVERVIRHVRKKLEGTVPDLDRRTLTLVPANDGRCFLQDSRGNYWRTYVFIEGARTYDVAERLEHVYEAAFAFGEFQRMISDLEGPRLHETIPFFHNTARRFSAFRETLKRDPHGRASSVREEIAFALRHERDASRLLDLHARGEIPERITHNDTKLNNVMIDDRTGKAVCVIDLDTVMPGFPMYDFGDAVRLGASTAAEDECDLSLVHFDLRRFEALTEGYLDAARGFLLPKEIDCLAFSAVLMTFECGLRFLTDHLAGDVYFKVHRPCHNLDRCRTQFKMVAEMEERMDRMREIVAAYAVPGGCTAVAGAHTRSGSASRP